MFNKVAYDQVDVSLDGIFWAGERILPEGYPLVAHGDFIGNFDLPFRHFYGVGTVSQWTGKFPERLELAPSAQEWFVMHRSAMGHQKSNFDPKFTVPDLSDQLYIVTDQPRYLLPVTTPVVIEYMHWLRQCSVAELSVTNTHKGASGFIAVLCNLHKGNFLYSKHYEENKKNFTGFNF